MSELKARKFFEVVPTSKAGFYQPGAFVDGYLKAEADKVIAEKDKEILDLIEKVQKERAAKVDYKISANDLRTGLEKAYEEIRMLRRALWLARAWFCGRSSEYFSGMASRCKIGQEDFYREVSERARKYMKSSYKCRTKAEEYK